MLRQQYNKQIFSIDIQDKIIIDVLTLRDCIVFFITSHMSRLSKRIIIRSTH